jgi:hypothetical protein
MASRIAPQCVAVEDMPGNICSQGGLTIIRVRLLHTTSAIGEGTEPELRLSL